MLAGTGLGFDYLSNGFYLVLLWWYICFLTYCSGDSQIIHIDVEQIFPALWTYTVDSQSHLLVGIPGSRTIDYGIPAIIGFVVLIFIALFYMRKDNGEQCNYE